MINQILVFHFIVTETMKSIKNIGKPVIEKFIISDFLMADNSSKQQKVYILGEVCHVFTLYSAIS